MSGGGFVRHSDLDIALAVVSFSVGSLLCTLVLHDDLDVGSVCRRCRDGLPLALD